MLKKQRGQSLISWLFLLAALVYIVILGIKIIPVYIENYGIKSMLENISSHPTLEPLTSSQLKSLVTQNINSDYEQSIKEKKITVLPVGVNQYKVLIDYSTATPVPLSSTFELVGHFHIDEMVSTQ